MRFIKSLLGRSVVLLKVDVDGILAVPSERNAPRTVHVNRVTLRLAPQGMKVESWQGHFARVDGGVQSV
jgi:hypothetical protein